MGERLRSRSRERSPTPGRSFEAATLEEFAAFPPVYGFPPPPEPEGDPAPKEGDHVRRNAGWSCKGRPVSAQNRTTKTRPKARRPPPQQHEYAKPPGRVRTLPRARLMEPSTAPPRTCSIPGRARDGGMIPLDTHEIDSAAMEPVAPLTQAARERRVISSCRRPESHPDRFRVHIRLERINPPGWPGPDAGPISCKGRISVSASTGQPATTLQAYGGWVFGPDAGAQIAGADDRRPSSAPSSRPRAWPTTG